MKNDIVLPLGMQRAKGGCNRHPESMGILKDERFYCSDCMAEKEANYYDDPNTRSMTDTGALERYKQEKEDKNKRG